ncbi:MAG: isocitrate lyase/phosphoenolpyruvate mutase family protein, partial [Pseudomonadota bacterium]
QALAGVRLVAGSVDVPVSADIERGFGDDPQAIAATIAEVIDAGAVGINIEDSIDGGTQRDIAEMQARIRGARDGAGDFPLWINARVDAYLLGKSGDDVYSDTIARAAAWIAAGADSIFVPGPKDAGLIAQLVADISAPLNVIVIDETTLSVAELKALGVARVSTGPRLMQAAMTGLHAAIRSIREDGDFRFLEDATGFGALQKLMRH